MTDAIAALLARAEERHEARRHAIGANNPPEPIDPAEPFKSRVHELIGNTDQWLGRVQTITSPEMADACDSNLALLRAEYKALDEARKEAKRPHDEAAAAVQAAFKPLLERVETAAKLLKPLKEAWLLAEQARLDAERRAAEEAALEALREAEEAQARAAASKTVDAAIAAQDAADAAERAIKAADAPPVRAQVRGELTGRASGLKTYWSARVVDWDAALRHYANHPAVRNAVQMAADYDARKMKDRLDVPGVQPRKEERV